MYIHVYIYIYIYIHIDRELGRLHAMARGLESTRQVQMVSKTSFGSHQNVVSGHLVLLQVRQEREELIRRVRENRVRRTWTLNLCTRPCLDGRLICSA